MGHEDFVQRVMQRLPGSKPSSFTFQSWKHGGRPTDEGFGMMPIAGVDPEKIAGAVMDLDHYVGNVEHVAECRTIADDRFGDGVRFYQKVDIPLLGSVQHELVLYDMGEINGYRVLAWDVLRSETDALNAKKGFRSDYNQGAWLAADAGFGTGGRVTVGGNEGSVNQENTRFGLTLAYPLTRRASLKAAWITGVSTRLGADFDSLILLYQYRWGGGL